MTEKWKTAGAAGSPLSAVEFFGSLRALYRRRALGAASERAFGWIWLRCGAKVTAAHRLYVPELAEYFNRSISAAQDWIDRLQDAELVYVRNRTIKARVPQAWVIMDVYHPNPEVRDPPVRVDPQRRFGFMDDEDRAPPFAARGPHFDDGNPAIRFPKSGTPGLSDQEPDQKPPGFPKRPCDEAVLMGVESLQVPLGQAYRTLYGDRSGGGSSRARARVKPRSLRLKQRLKPEASRASAPQNDLTSGQEFFDRIFQELGDLELLPAPVRKVTAKLEEGTLDWQTVQRVIDASRFKFRQGQVEAPWKYFVGAMRRIFEERDWQWRRRMKP